MARLDIDFTDQALPDDSFDAIPAGWYAAEIADSEIRDTKAGDKMLVLRWKVLGPTHAGRVVWQNVMLTHAKSEVVEIGRQTLHRVAMALGQPRIADTRELHGKPCDVKLTLRRDPEWGDKNEIKGWRKGSGGSTPPPAYTPPKDDQGYF